MFGINHVVCIVSALGATLISVGGGPPQIQVPRRQLRADLASRPFRGPRSQPCCVNSLPPMLLILRGLFMHRSCHTCSKGGCGCIYLLLATCVYLLTSVSCVFSCFPGARHSQDGGSAGRWDAGFPKGQLRLSAPGSPRAALISLASRA